MWRNHPDSPRGMDSNHAVRGICKLIPFMLMRCASKASRKGDRIGSHQHAAVRPSTLFETLSHLRYRLALYSKPRSPENDYAACDLSRSVDHSRRQSAMAQVAHFAI